MGQKNRKKKYRKKLTLYALESRKSREISAQFMLFCTEYFSSSILNTWTLFHEPIFPFFFSPPKLHIHFLSFFVLLQELCCFSFHITSSSIPNTIPCHSHLFLQIK